ncbi:MAG: ACP S-malonyltransferase [Myxococcota bacterium]|nr:ACP S-malonyltransferase [Myxococcota bacterium]
MFAPRVVHTRGEPSSRRTRIDSLVLALIFPGQGSQEVGMGRDAFEASTAARAVYDAADEALGFPISRVCFEGPEEELQRTEIQQPALLTTSVALLRALEEKTDLKPDFVAGHSLGEYTALVAAGALGLEDAVRTVHRRGGYMQEAVPQGVGSMAAIIGSTPEAVADVCAEVSLERGSVVSPANFNSPGQTVIAGEAASVEDAGKRAAERGAKRVIPLKVSAPFHCSLMMPAADQIRADLDSIQFSDASPPVITNVEAKPNTAASRMVELLQEQVTAPVRFTEMVQWLVAAGVTHFLEVGSGRVLSGLVSRIQRRSQRAQFSGMQDLESVEEFLQTV